MIPVQDASMAHLMSKSLIEALFSNTCPSSKDTAARLAKTAWCLHPAPCAFPKKKETESTFSRVKQHTRQVNAAFAQRF